MARYLWLSVLCVVLDQATKVWAESTLQLYERIAIWPFFNLTLVYNQGAAFSFLGDASGWQRWLFVVLAVIISVVLIVWLLRLKPGEGLIAIALSLVIGGAIGNLIDRLIYGHVIDFLDFYWQDWHWPAFNIADSCISIGVVFLLADSFLAKK